jgi:hypothetical protein
MSGDFGGRRMSNAFLPLPAGPCTGGGRHNRTYPS